MIITDGTREIEYLGDTRIVIGKFDGIHAGHRELIRHITERNDSLASVVFTFKGIPFQDAGDVIFSDADRRNIFEGLGVDFLVEFNLDRETMKISPIDFVTEILKKRLHVKEIICGPDLSFGYEGRGNVDFLKGLQSELDIKVTVIDKVQYMGEDISSTRIRNAIKAGNVDDADRMLRGTGL